jgi:tetratricopeptide (TPR) repeat protein
MIVRIASRALRMILVVGALAIAGASSYFGIRNTLAVHYAEKGTLEGYERATQLEPGNARNWYLLGRYWEFDPEHTDPQRALHAYQTSLSLDPRSADTWLDMATLLEVSDPGAAREAFLEAQRAYPASPDFSWRYGNFLLRKGEMIAAFREIRHAVEADPKRSVDAFLLFRRLEPDLDIVLERDIPPIPGVYLDLIRLLTDEGRADLALTVWPRLIAVHPKLHPPEILYLVEGLLNRRQAIEARRVWDQAIPFMNIPKTDDPEGSLVWDGGFETGVTGSGFAWRTQPPAGSFVDYDENVKRSGKRALRIRFDGQKNVYFQGVCERVLVEPGAIYEFSAWLKTSELTTDRGVFFRLTTPEIQGSPGNATPAFTGSTPWTRVSLTWEAPRQANLLEICVVRLPSPNADEYRVSGTAWVDNVSLLPVTASGDSLEKTRP